jgi:proteasome lid subunit RPN8/RPN11
LAASFRPVDRSSSALPDPIPILPIERVVLTDEVGRRLFDEYAAHRRSDRGREETGWMLLGHRAEKTATVLATLPAGARRDAGVEHVRFNAEAQALASRIVRQRDKRLALLGVVHTHPGTLRHPSRGDLRGDREWIRELRGRQGVFAIGTIDEGGSADVATHPQTHVQSWQGLRFDWYTLAEGDDAYAPVKVEMTIGPDLAAALRPAWPAIEAHADRIERLVRQQAGLRFELVDAMLMVIVPLAEPGGAIRIAIEAKRVRFFHETEAGVFQADLPVGTEPDRGAYLMLAELAK